jgi:type 1 glutamine amidotransferase
MRRIALCFAALVLVAPPVPAQNKKVLLITESKGFRHGVVTRKTTLLLKDLDPNKLPKIDGLDLGVRKEKDGKITVTAHYAGVIGSEPLEFRQGNEVVARCEPCLAEKTFIEMGKNSGLFEVVCSQDSRREIVAENLKKFDAVWFYTTGPLPLSDTQKADLLDFVRKGKGFGGCHSATDTFYNWEEYGKLIGGYFDGHPWHQKVKVRVEVKDHPATKHLGDSFEITDEIYQFKAPYSRENNRVLMKLDMDGLKAGKRGDMDNALAWTRDYGQGRVFYTALGHRDEVWKDKRFQQQVIGGLRYLFRMD